MHAVVLLAALLAGCTACTACGSRAPRYPSVEGIAGPDAERIWTYAEDFESRLGRPLRSQVVLAPELDFPPDVVGYCRPATDWSPPLIELDAHWWWLTDDAGRWAVVNHELAHCELGLDHIEAVHPLTDCPLTPVQADLDLALACLRGGRTTPGELLDGLPWPEVGDE